ncbi:hypothetical protein HDU97_009311 [Phlyctochytrium planicorne]|nr:hypothetical protein HDU97_009311 [Phlyctochytrium planicorne]
MEGYGGHEMQRNSSYRSDSSRRQTTFREDMNSTSYFTEASEPHLPSAGDHRQPQRDFPPLPSNSSREFTRLRGGYESDREPSGNGPTFYSFRPSAALPESGGGRFGVGSRPLSPRSSVDPSSMRVDYRAPSPLSGLPSGAYGARRNETVVSPLSRQPPVTSPNRQHFSEYRAPSPLSPFDRSSRPMSPYTPQERYNSSSSSSRTGSSEHLPKAPYPISEDLARTVLSDVQSEDEGFLSESGSYRERRYNPQHLQHHPQRYLRDKLPSSVAVSVGSSVRDMHLEYDEPQRHDHPDDSQQYGSDWEDRRRMPQQRPGGNDYDADYYSEAESQARSYRSREGSATSISIANNGYYSDVGSNRDRSGVRAFVKREPTIQEGSVSTRGYNDYTSQDDGGRSDERRKNPIPQLRPRPTLAPAHQQVYPSNASSSRYAPDQPYRHESQASIDAAFGSASSSDSVRIEDRRRSVDAYKPSVSTALRPDESGPASGRTPTQEMFRNAQEDRNLHVNDGPIPFFGDSSASKDFQGGDRFGAEGPNGKVLTAGNSSDSLTMEIDAIRSKVDDLRQKFISARSGSNVGNSDSVTGGGGDKKAVDQHHNSNLTESTDSGLRTNYTTTSNATSTTNATSNTAKPLSQSPITSPSSSRPSSARARNPLPVPPPKPEALRQGSLSSASGKPSPITTSFAKDANSLRGPMSASGMVGNGKGTAVLAELGALNDTLNRLDRHTLENSISCMVRNLRHALTLTLDVNQMLNEGSDNGLTASATSLVRNMTDVQVSTLSMLLRMMEQFEKENRMVMDALETTGSASVLSASAGAGGQNGPMPNLIFKNV